MLLKGFFIRKQKRSGQRICYILYDARINPVLRLKNNIIRVLHNNVPEKYEILKYSKNGDISFNLSVVRQLHGNHTIKRLYKIRQDITDVSYHPPGKRKSKKQKAKSNLSSRKLKQHFFKMKKAPENNRVKRNSPLATDSSYGNNGVFIIPHYKIKEYSFFVIISDGMGWEHVSVTLISFHRNVERCCTWEEMCFIKDQFFYEDEVAMQLHPAKKDYVSTHPYCLHLWRPTNQVIPCPDPTMVGNLGDNVQKL